MYGELPPNKSLLSSGVMHKGGIMKTQIISIFSILFLLTGCNAIQPKQNDASLPKPPDGFSWHIAKNGVGTFLKPDGWYIKEETKGQTNALCWVLK